jgi:cytoskeletal protein CcmA (bactofilin family)
MWRKEEANSQASPDNSAPSGSPKAAPSPISSTQTAGHKSPACVSQGIKIKGEVVGTEDLFIDGIVDGKVTLANSVLTVGPNGTVKAEIAAREVVLRGVAEGKFTADERIQIWHTARVQGELKAERISIEDGAELRGKVEAGKTPAKSATNEIAGKNKKNDHKAAEATAKDVNATTDAATAGAD